MSTYNICFYGELKISTCNSLLSRTLVRNITSHNVRVHVCTIIALDKALFFQPKSVYFFLISQRKHMLWVHVCGNVRLPSITVASPPSG